MNRPANILTSIPVPQVIRERIACNLKENRVLEKLLRASEAATQLRPTVKDGVKQADEEGGDQ